MNNRICSGRSVAAAATSASSPGSNSGMHDLGPVSIRRWAYPAAATAETLTRYRDAAAQAPRELTTAFIVTTDALALRAIWTGSVVGADTRSRPLRVPRRGPGSQDGHDLYGTAARERRAPAVGSAVLLQGRVPGRDGRSCHRRHRGLGRGDACPRPRGRTACSLAAPSAISMRTQRRIPAGRARSIGSPRVSGTVRKTTSGPSAGAAAPPGGLGNYRWRQLRQRTGRHRRGAAAPTARRNIAAWRSSSGDMTR